ncbi:MAG: Asp-tRNA(Asn)/Glu-tRNA(Gln) amidotransferase subunit GatC [Verrucomicrobiae bacterium]|nr:Asp-tRNA(Asn)/Glu-tRNA(Gln) amidotransferase subunit GatC [Verrucomicrobiae bacterium]
MGKVEIDVAYVAHLARLELNDGEAEAFQGQLDGVLGHIAALGRLDLEGIEPTAHAAPIHNVFRADEPRESVPESDALANAPLAANGLFITPKIVE